MTFFVKFFLISCLLFFSCSLYAEVSCPPTSLITGVKFYKAKRALDQHWEMLSRDFVYEKYRWNVYFLIKLPNSVTTPAEALKWGQAYFDSKVRLAEPTPLNDTSLPPTEDYPLTCSYDAGISGYGVLAQSPPLK